MSILLYLPFTGALAINAIKILTDLIQDYEKVMLS